MASKRFWFFAIGSVALIPLTPMAIHFFSPGSLQQLRLRFQPKPDPLAERFRSCVDNRRPPNCFQSIALDAAKQGNTELMQRCIDRYEWVPSPMTPEVGEETYTKDDLRLDCARYLFAIGNERDARILALQVEDLPSLTLRMKDAESTFDRSSEEDRRRIASNRSRQSTTGVRQGAQRSRRFNSQSDLDRFWLELENESAVIETILGTARCDQCGRPKSSAWARCSSCRQ